MIRDVVAGVLGYVAMAVTVMVLFTVAYVAMGTEGAFRPESFEVSGAWTALSLVIGFGAAVLGGIVCGRIAAGPSGGPKGRGTLVLVGLVVLLAAWQILAGAGVEPETLERTAEIGMGDAMDMAVVPGWLNWINPLVGVAGVLAGSRMSGSAGKSRG